MLCTLATRILGFVRNATIAALFGATGRADVLNTVFAIPNSFRKLTAEGALSSAFIPVISDLLVREGAAGSARTAPRARRLFSNVVTLQMVLLALPLTAAAVVPRGAIYLLTEFTDPDQIDLAAGLFRWVAHYLLLVSVVAVIMAVLNSHGIFVIPALTPLFFSICVIASLMILHRRMGIYALAVGVLAGGVGQILFQWPRLKKLGYRFFVELGWRNPDLRRVLRLWLPVVATSSIFTVNQLIAMRFASGLARGSATALSFAVVFWQLPFGVFSASVTTVLFPRMSRQAAEGDKGGLVSSVSYGLRFLIVLLVPAAVFYLLLGDQAIAVAYQRGAFTAAATQTTARVLSGYSLGLLSVGAFNFLQRFFYSLHDYRTPLWTATVVVTLDIALSLWLKETPLAVAGLAVANSVSFSVGLVILLLAARKRLGHLSGKAIGLDALRAVGAVVPATVAVRLGLRGVAERLAAAGTWERLGWLTVGFVLFSGLIMLVYWLTGVEMARDLVKRGRRE
jgi:putative peptidoglycan lipid II flippase